jgi:hypothetical protein
VPALREAIREEEEAEAEARVNGEVNGKGKAVAAKGKRGKKGKGGGGEGEEKGEKDKSDGRAGPRSENVVLSKSGFFYSFGFSLLDLADLTFILQRLIICRIYLRSGLPFWHGCIVQGLPFPRDIRPSCLYRPTLRGRGSGKAGRGGLMMKRRRKKRKRRKNGRVGKRTGVHSPRAVVAAKDGTFPNVRSRL